MEAAAVIMDAVARMRALPPDDGEQSRFDRALQSLQANDSETFMIRQAISGPEDRLTVPQARALSEALQRSTSVTTFVSTLRFCSLPAVHLFVDYIRTSPILKELWAGYSPRPSDSPEIQNEYKSQLDLLFQAVLENPNITTLNAISLTTPDTIYQFLSRCTTLIEFRSAGQSITHELALAVAAGICRSGITKLVLGVEHGPLDVIVSRIGASRVQTMTLWHGQMDAVFCQAISKMLLFTPRLIEVNIADATQSDTQGHLGKIFFDLQHDACAGLKRLHLEDTCLANISSAANDDDDEEEADNNIDAVDVIVPTIGQRANETLERLSLRSVRFQTASDVRLLWKIIGLKELCVGSPSILFVESENDGEEQEEGNIHDNDDEGDDDANGNGDNDYGNDDDNGNGDDANGSNDGDGNDDDGNGNDGDGNGNGNDELALEIWTTFIRRNDKLDKIDLILNTNDSDYTFLEGILQGARNHPTLSIISIHCEPFVVLSGDVGQRLCQVLQETSSLKALKINGAHSAAACITFLAQGLTDNRSLQVLHVSYGSVEILQSLLVHETLQELVLERFLIGERRGAFCQTLSQFFRSNKTLTKLSMDGVDLRAGVLAESFEGLPGNKSLKILSLDVCFIDTEGMTALGQSLESTDIAVKELVLPNTADPLSAPVLMTAFLQSVPRMPTIRKIDFGGTMPFPNQEERCLLLQAAMENKTLLTLDGCAPVLDDASAESDMAMIKYYLKLNQFGRCILDSHNIQTSLWPRLLSPMTTRRGHAVSLFYFVREYFSRQSEPINDLLEVQQLPQLYEAEAHQPAQKRARLE